MPNDLGIAPRDYQLLEKAAEVEGEDIMTMLQRGTLDSFAVGICTKCENITSDVEIDASENWCEECCTLTVRSVLDIAGLI